MAGKSKRMNLKLGLIISFALGRIEALDSKHDLGNDRQRRADATHIDVPTFSPVDVQIPLGFADEQSPPEPASPVESASETNQGTPNNNNKNMTEPTTEKSESQDLVTGRVEPIEDKPNNTSVDPPKHDATWCETYFAGEGNTCWFDMPSGASWVECTYSESNHLQICTCTEDDPFWRCKGSSTNSDEFGTDTSEPSIESEPEQNITATETANQSSVEVTNTTSVAPSSEESEEEPNSEVFDESLSTPPGNSTGANEEPNTSTTAESNTDLIDEEESPSQQSSEASNESSSTLPGNSTGTKKVPVPSPTSEPNEVVDVDATESPSLVPEVGTTDMMSPSISTNDQSKNNENSVPVSAPVDWPSFLSPTEETGSPAIVPSLPPSSSSGITITQQQQVPPGLFLKRTSPPTSLPTTPMMACRNASPDERRAIIFDYLSSLSGKEAIDDIEHPAFMAGSWIADEDRIKVCPGDPNFTQRYILALLYFSTSGDDWVRCARNSTTQCATDRFLSDFNECNWGGVTCDSQQRVMKLNLDENNMNGSIPDELRYLERLYELDLDSNNLVGHFPSWVGTMKYLEKLDLDRNILSGPIPEELYTSKTLKFVDMDRNILSGTISSNIGSMTQLVFFQADFNQLIGTIPTEIANISDLQYFSIFGNGFDESVGIPFEICGFHTQIYANCEMCEEVGDCCTVCLPEDLSGFY